MALSSSAAIGGWLVWKEIPYLWAVIIGASQILQTVSPLLPHKQRLKALHGLSVELDALCIRSEEDWNSVINGKISDDEIHALYIKHKKKAQQIFDENMKGLGLPDSPKLLAKAKKMAYTYFSNQYSTSQE